MEGIISVRWKKNAKGKRNKFELLGLGHQLPQKRTKQNSKANVHLVAKTNKDKIMLHNKTVVSAIKKKVGLNNPKPANKTVVSATKHKVGLNKPKPANKTSVCNKTESRAEKTQACQQNCWQAT